MKCKHRGYKAKLKPRAACVPCWLKWYRAETSRMDRLAMYSPYRFDYGMSRAEAAFKVCDLLGAQ